MNDNSTELIKYAIKFGIPDEYVPEFIERFSILMECSEYASYTARAKYDAANQTLDMIQQ